MTKRELLQELKGLPMDMEVCIFDVYKNTENASDEPTGAGIYRVTNVYKALTSKELKDLKEIEPQCKNFIALEFINENK